MSTSGLNKGCCYNKLVRINSSNRLPGGTNNDFRIDLGVNLQQVQKVSITNVQFYNVFPNLYNYPTKSNNYIDIKVDNGISPVTLHVILPPGFYSVADALNTLASLVSSSFTLNWSMNPITNYVSIWNTTGGLTITFQSPTVPSGVTPPLGPLDPNVNVMTMLGFTLPFVLSNSSGSPSVAPNYPYMNHTTIAYLASSALWPGNAFDEKGSTFNIGLAIDIEAPWFGLNVFKCRQDILCEVQYARARPLNQIDIQLLDHEGNPLYLNQTELNIELRVWFNNTN